MTPYQYAQCRCAVCHDLFIVMLSVIMLSVVMLSAVAPKFLVLQADTSGLGFVH
jgi:hypothetical protein